MLVLLNGLPGSGKSTLARRWCAHRPLALALDLDVLRGMLGGWRDQRIDAGAAARSMAASAAGVHLRAGHDVVVAQFVERADLPEQLAAVAAASGAAFLDCALLVDPGLAAERLRSRPPGEEGELGEPVEAVAARFTRFLATRPGTVRLDGAQPALEDQLDRAVASARARR